ncbi:hypothetical protein [Streptomyces sp. NPDC086989]|uniref:SCO2400 family protein n=1 Tax=Streptomyces sp. NPDC086989 TaxID=3365764 RepID=UPI00380DB514
MDYCHACRRHLNGALACAGCGTPVEYLPPVVPGGPAVPAAPYGSAPYGSTGPEAADPFADSIVVLAGEHHGRSGARRRATHRRRRRTLLTIGLGLTLAVGGTVALARIVTEGQKTDRAAEVVLTDGDGPQDPAPLPSGHGTPAAPSALKPVKASGAAKAGAGGTKPAAPGTSTEGPTTEPGPSGSASAPGRTGPTKGAPGPGPSVKPGQSGSASPSASGTAQPPPAPVPSPSPTPTKGCILWIFC